jgi:hydrogenase nickel incorporation protein HypA/HybF
LGIPLANVVRVHEISIIQSLIELVEEQLEPGDTCVTSVTVGLGPLSGVVPMAFQFAFEVATFGTVLQRARLEIQTNALVVWCDACAAEREPIDVNHLRCPVCNQRTPTIVRGMEMELLRIEVSDGKVGEHDRDGDNRDNRENITAANPGGSPADPEEK